MSARVTLEQWCDAFEMHLEVLAEARDNPEIRRDVNAAVRQVKERARRGELNQTHVNNQEHVAKALGFNPESYRAQQTAWRSIRPTILNLGWDLTEEIHFEQSPRGGIDVWQDHRGRINFRGGEAFVANAFLEFVQQFGVQASPIEIVRTALEMQGITAENFERVAKENGLGIKNPWKP